MRFHHKNERNWEDSFAEEIAIKYDVIAYRFEIPGQKGGYDRLLLSKQGIAFMEAKFGDNQPSAHQDEFRRMLDWAKIPNKVAHLKSEAVQWVQQLVVEGKL